MRSIQEMEARIAASQKSLDARINVMTEKIDRMAAQFNKEMQTERVVIDLKIAFAEGEKVKHYKWTYEYSFMPTRKCFTTQEPILPGTKAYKGIKKRPDGDHTFEYEFLPKEMWLTKEEFTLYSLKGQLL